MVSQNIAALSGRTKLVVPIISFVGNSGSGKTTLLEGVVRELKRLGYRVAVVKHAPHGFDTFHSHRLHSLIDGNYLCYIDEDGTERVVEGSNRNNYATVKSSEYPHLG